MAKNIIKITESQLKNAIMEAVQTAMNQQEEWGAFLQEERKELEPLLSILQRNGIQSAEMGAYRSGVPCILIDTDEYNKSNAYQIAYKFAESKGKYVREESYPATTYISLS